MSEMNMASISRSYLCPGPCRVQASVTGERPTGETADQLIVGSAALDLKQIASLVGRHSGALHQRPDRDGALDELHVVLDGYPLRQGQHVLHADPEVTTLRQ